MENTIIDESTGEVSNLTGDLTKIRNKIITNELPENFMDEHCMLFFAAGLSFVLSILSGYTFFNSSSMIIIIIVNMLLKIKVDEIKINKN